MNLKAKKIVTIGEFKNLTESGHVIINLRTEKGFIGWKVYHMGRFVYTVDNNVVEELKTNGYKQHEALCGAPKGTLLLKKVAC